MKKYISLWLVLFSGLLHASSRQDDPNGLHPIITPADPLNSQKPDWSLYNAIVSGDTETALLLIEKLFDCMPYPMANEESYLHYAVQYGRVEIVKALLYTDLFDVDQIDSEGHTPLYYLLMMRTSRGTSLRASSQDYIAIAELLIEHGADIEKEDTDGLTPLYYAGVAGHEDIARLLIDISKKRKQSFGKHNDIDAIVLDGLFN